MGLMKRAPVCGLVVLPVRRLPTFDFSTVLQAFATSARPSGFLLESEVVITPSTFNLGPITGLDNQEQPRMSLSQRVNWPLTTFPRTKLTSVQISCRFFGCLPTERLHCLGFRCWEHRLCYRANRLNVFTFPDHRSRDSDFGSGVDVANISVAGLGVIRNGSRKRPIRVNPCWSRKLRFFEMKCTVPGGGSTCVVDGYYWLCDATIKLLYCQGYCTHNHEGNMS